MSGDNGMNRPYQGKDIVSKILTNTFGEKTFAVFGVKDFPAIKGVFTDRTANHRSIGQDIRPCVFA